MTIEAVKLYRTSDGTTFDDRAKAEAHEAVLTVARWLEGQKADGLDVRELVRVILADPEAARAALMPLMPVKRQRGPDKAPRKRKARAQAAPAQAA